MRGILERFFAVIKLIFNYSSTSKLKIDSMSVTSAELLSEFECFVSVSVSFVVVSLTEVSPLSCLSDLSVTDAFFVSAETVLFLLSFSETVSASVSGAAVAFAAEVVLGFSETLGFSADFGFSETCGVAVAAVEVVLSDFAVFSFFVVSGAAVCETVALVLVFDVLFVDVVVLEFFALDVPSGESIVIFDASYPNTLSTNTLVSAKSQIQ